MVISAVDDRRARDRLFGSQSLGSEEEENLSGSSQGGMVGIKFNQLFQKSKRAVDKLLKLFLAASSPSNS